MIGVAVSKDQQFSIRLEQEVSDRAEELVAKLGGIASRAAVMRMAMVEGLAVLEERYRNFPPGGVPVKQRKKR
jgi:Arc/MetJ-type ribon-helix-helix transcriptional regulator